MKYLILWTLFTHGAQDGMQDGILLTVDTINPEFYESPEHRVCPVIDTRLEKSGCWTHVPDVLICYDGPVGENRMRSAMRYWERLGYQFGTVSQAARDNQNCVMNNVPYGTIMVDIPSQTFQFGRHLGTTRVWRSNAARGLCEPAIFKAKIEIIPAWGDSERILEHEIGHALGWNDINETGHIMNGTWSNGGHSSRGLRNAQ